MNFETDTLYVVELYAAGAEYAADCLGEFFATEADAIAAGSDEIRRVADLADTEREKTFDWAVRFTVRACPPTPYAD